MAIASENPAKAPLDPAFQLQSSKPYGHYDLRRLLTVTETPAGRQRALDGAYLDRMLSDLSTHAKNYPAHFASPEDKARAIKDVQLLSGMLDIVVNEPNPDPELLVRAAYLNSMGHNLDIAGTAVKADNLFQRLLAGSPASPRGNYLYGTFLANTARPMEALPYLDKARELGIVEAIFALGMAQLTLGDKEQALGRLEEYRRLAPGKPHLDQLIDAVRNGRIEFRKHPD